MKKNPANLPYFNTTYYHMLPLSPQGFVNTFNAIPQLRVYDFNTIKTKKKRENENTFP